MTDEEPTDQSHRITTYEGRTSVRSLLQRLRTFFFPKLVPLAICLGALPILILFSLAAGWVVWRNRPERWRVPMYLQYGEGVPHSDVEIRTIASGQPYDISLHLSVPATDSNYALGNFMVSLSLRTTSNATLLDVRKPALVLPASRSLFNPFGSSRLIDVVVPLASSIPMHYSRFTARVDIGRSDSWKGIGNGQGRELTVYEAYLRGSVKPQGLQRIISAFPLSSSLAAAATFFCISALILSACLVQAALQQGGGDLSEESEVIKEEEEEEEIVGLGAAEQTGSLTALRRRRSRSQNVTESGAHAYPTPEPDVQRRNRRRSSSMQADEPS